MYQEEFLSTKYETQEKNIQNSLCYKICLQYMMVIMIIVVLVMVLVNIGHVNAGIDRSMLKTIEAMDDIDNSDGDSDGDSEDNFLRKHDWIPSQEQIKSPFSISST